jgi:hypothetical protein
MWLLFLLPSNLCIYLCRSLYINTESERESERGVTRFLYEFNLYINLLNTIMKKYLFFNFYV